MQLFFVYMGDAPTMTEPTPVYVDRLRYLNNAEIVAAFPTRARAVEFALNYIDKEGNRIDYRPVVVVERDFSMQEGDSNNLISVCEWQKAHDDSCSSCPPPKPEPEITGNLVIHGNPYVGETLTAIVHNEEFPAIATAKEDNEDEKESLYHYQWFRGITRNWYKKENYVGEMIPDAYGKEYILTNADIGKYISVKVTKDEHKGKLWASTYKAIQEIPELPELTGTIEIDGFLRVGETLNADVSNLNGEGQISYRWFKSEDNITWEPITHGTTDYFVLTVHEENMYIQLVVSREGYQGTVHSDIAGPVVGG